MPDRRGAQLRQSARIALFALLLCRQRTLLGQTTGRIEGTVRDGARGAVPGVIVEASSPSCQGVRVATTDAEGRFRLPALPPGTYTVHATLAGFRSSDRLATVSLDGTATTDLALEPAAEEKVVVSGEAPRIDFASTTTGTNYTSSVVANLPVARNYADIVKSNPGVSTDRGATEGRSLALSIYGATSAENQWIIDGVNTTNVLRGVQGKAINNEFVQEVEVKTGGYQAEYGRALGGVINVITKSGGNTFHGDGFVYYDSTRTAAAAEFKPGDSGLDQMRFVSGDRFDYGFDLGGYFLKDRLWFFAAYNRVSLSGDLSRVQSSAHVPDRARFPLDSTEDLYSGKLTWNVSSATSIVGSVFADPSSTAGAAGADPRQGLGSVDIEPPVSLDPSTWYSQRAQGGTDFGLRVNQVFGANTFAMLIGSYHKDRNSLDGGDGIRYIDRTCADGTPEKPCNVPQEPNSITGGYGLVNGLGDNGDSHRAQAAGSATFYRGNHELRAGADYMDGLTNGAGYYSGGQTVILINQFGQLFYGHDFYAVNPEDPTAVVPDRPLRAEVIDYGVFLQDSWRALPNLTINVGLRWDGETTRDYAGSTVLKFNNQWQPRIGLVWDPWANGATKISAFVGRFSYALPTIGAAAAFWQGTLVETYNFDPVSVVPDLNVMEPYPNPNIFPLAYPYSVDKGIRAPHEDELTLAVERLITPSLTVALKGTYRSLGDTVEDRCDFDYTMPESDFTGCAFVNPGSGAKFSAGDAPTCTGFEADEQCFPRGVPTPEAKRIYRGIELFARQVVGNNLWLQASYVHSSLKGNYDGGVNQAVYGQTTPAYNTDFDYPALWHNAYGALGLDRPNRFRFDGFWVTPWRVSIGLQAFAESGTPLNEMGYFNRDYGPLIFLVPRGSAGRLPTYWGTNLTASYPFVIGPATVTLQAYLFNMFNKQIAISRDDSYTTSITAGYPDTAFDPNQEQTNPYYGAVNHRSQPRVFRAAVRVSF